MLWVRVPPPEPIVKRCVVCKRNRRSASFSANRARPDGRQNRCKYCDRRRSRKYYLKNKKKMQSQIYANRERRVLDVTEKVCEFLRSHPCVDCGEKDLCVLEFDHVRGKKHSNVSKLISEGYSFKTVYGEIKKCEVRCANCHRRKTLLTRGHRRQRFIR